MSIRSETAHWCNLGVGLESEGRLEEAADSYRRALELQPELSVPWCNLGNVLKQQGKHQEAVDCYRQAIRVRPDKAEAYNSLAVTILGERMENATLLDEGAALLEQAIRADPEYADSFKNLGALRKKQGRRQDALACYDAALRLEPADVSAHVQRAFLLLADGNFLEGWQEYEWRFRDPSFPLRQLSVPQWDGSSLGGRTILLHAEQGLGDAIQFMRYAALVKQRGGTVLLLCPPALTSLAATCPGIDHVSGGGNLLFDVHASLMSLPAILGTTVDTIPARASYLSADPQRAEFWRRELAEEKRFKVGIVWQGNPRAWNPSHQEANRLRSADLRCFAPLAEVPGVALFSLQVGPGSEQVASADVPLTDLGSRSVPMDNLAAILVNMDLLITVDTGPGHLAGALGVPAWIALGEDCCWRWMLDRSDSPWYPLHRLFRQKEADNWQPVFDQIAQTLRQVVQDR
jgi:hypothetical protein